MDPKSLLEALNHFATLCLKPELPDDCRIWRLEFPKGIELVGVWGKNPRKLLDAKNDTSIVIVRVDKEAEELMKVKNRGGYHYLDIYAGWATKLGQYLGRDDEHVPVSRLYRIRPKEDIRQVIRLVESEFPFVLGPSLQ